MRREKWVITAELVEGRDDDLIEKLDDPTVNKSVIVRQALRVYFGQEPEIIARLKRIESLVSGGDKGLPDEQKTGNPFLDSAL